MTKPRQWCFVLRSKILLALILGGTFQIALAQEHAWAPNFSVGLSIPEISAEDQNGILRTFDDLKGEKGLLFMLSRSFDWWPFCKAQLVQLIEISGEFKAMGINIATMTYDSIDTLKIVEENQGIEFPLLHDEGITYVNALGILNEDYDPGSRAYGVPHPGIFLLDPNGVIQAKFAEEGYRARPDFDDVLEAAANL